MKSISSLDEFHQLIQIHPTIIIKFSAKWCGPCKAIQPFFEQLASTNPGIFFATCDCDLCPEISDLCSIESLPTFIKFKQGKKVQSVSGSSKTELAKLVQQ
jgi:thioredoxin 1